MFIILAVANGGLTVLSRVVNAVLSDRVGSLRGSLINHAVGWFGTGLLLTFSLSTGTLHLGEVPWFYLSGGCLGVLVVAASNYAVRHIGTALFSVLLLTFQLITSAVIDHFALLGQKMVPLTAARVVGLVLLAFGAALVLTDQDRSLNATVEDTSTSASKT